MLCLADLYCPFQSLYLSVSQHIQCEKYEENTAWPLARMHHQHHQHHQQVVVPSLCQMVGGAIIISYETDFPPAFFNNCTAIMLRCTRLSFMQQPTPEQDLPCKKNQPKLQSTLPRSQNSDEKSEAKTIEIILLMDLNLAQGWQC